MIKIQVSTELMASWYKAGSVVDAFRVADGLPADAVLQAVEIDPSNSYIVNLFYSSASSAADAVDLKSIVFERVGERIVDPAPLDYKGDRSAGKKKEPAKFGAALKAGDEDAAIFSEGPK